MAVSLYLSDILNKVFDKSDIKKTLLIRHSLKDNKGNDMIEKCYKKGYLKEYTSVQGRVHLSDYEHLIVFVGGKGTSARLVACYKTNSKKPIEEAKSTFPADFPDRDKFGGSDDSYYPLENSDALREFEKEYKERLVIEWGKDTINWTKPAIDEKRILSIGSKTEKPFPGYEDDELILSYQKLEKIVEKSEEYESWGCHLSLINAIYIIVHEKDGAQYVGSSYSKKGLLGRWTKYTEGDHSGDNEEIKEFLKTNAHGYEKFRFSILKILPRDITQKEAVDIENVFKKKLLTKKFGLNRN